MRIKVSGININYRFSNENAADKDGPVVVFLHEGLGSIGQWKDFPDKLCRKAGLKGLLYDRQGYGASDFWPGDIPVDFLKKEGQEILPQLLKDLDIDRYILFGHSDGATIALYHASQNPVKLEGAVIEAPHVFIEEKTVEGVMRLKEKIDSELLRRMDKYQNGRAAQLVEKWLDYWLDPRFFHWNMFDELQEINTPLMLIQGENDEYGSFKQLDEIAERVGSNDVKRLQLSNCGHIPHLEQEEKVLQTTLQAIKRWLKRL